MIVCIETVDNNPKLLEHKKMNNDNDIDTNPYELKLFQMFKSCDTYQNGLLDEYGLSNLCRLLELQDGGFSLITNLSPNFDTSLGITFEQFKEALLQFLGTETESKPTISKEYLENEMPFHLDVLSSKDLIKIWEQANIPNGKNLLASLGIEDEEINLKQLYKIFEEELRSLESSSNSNLVHALTALQSAELAVLRQAVRQFKDENNKLHSDNKDANRRAAMLAAEIDECHASLEDRSKKELQSLEQRHSVALRDLNLRISNEREKHSQQTSELGSKIKSLEKERLQLAGDIEMLQNENSDLYVESQKLQKQNLKLHEENILLSQKLATLDTNKSDFISQSDDFNGKDEKISLLIEKMNRLQVENASLRDKNDELVMEIENLNAELDRTKNKYQKRSASSSNIIEPVKEDSFVLDSDESPLMSCQTEKSQSLNYDENSLISEMKSNDTAIAAATKETSLVDDLLNQIKELKEKLDSTKDSTKTIETLEQRCNDLETSLEQMQRAYDDCEEYWENKLAEERQLYEEEQMENDKKFTELMEKVREYEEQFKKDGRLSPIEERDMLEQQYEFLEAENEKILNEIEEKMKEIEELKNENSDLRLRLGESVEILTGACELNNEMGGNHRSLNNDSPAATPINYLWNQSTIQEPAKELENFSQLTEALTNSSDASKQSNRNNLTTSETLKFSTNLVENTPSVPVSPAKDSNSNVVDNLPNENENADYDSSSTASGKSFESHSISSSHSIQQTQSVSSHQSIRNTLKEELKRLKYYEISLKEQINDLTLQRDGLVMELQQLHEVKPVLEKSFARTAHPSLLQRVNQLEMKNRHMQNVIKQQQQYTETIMQQSWQQHQIELNDLHTTIEQQKVLLTDHSHRLQKADIVIKDLYVENSHLASAVQRLEEQKSRDSFLHQHQIPHQQQQRQCLNTMSGMP